MADHRNWVSTGGRSKQVVCKDYLQTKLRWKLHEEVGVAKKGDKRKGPRIDMCFQTKTRTKNGRLVMVVIEIDQHSHMRGDYTPEKDEDREDKIRDAYPGYAVIFLRVNPDSCEECSGCFRDNGDDLEVDEARLHKRLDVVVKDIKAAITAAPDRCQWKVEFYFYAKGSREELYNKRKRKY